MGSGWKGGEGGGWVGGMVMIDKNLGLYADYIGALPLRLGQANLSLDDSSSIVDIDHVVADRKSNKNYD